MPRQILKREAVLFASVLFLLFSAALALYRISDGTALFAAAQEQQTYTVTASAARCTVYDRNLEPLTGCGVTEYPAAVAPLSQTAAGLSAVLSPEEMSPVLRLLSGGLPFAVMLPREAEAPGVSIFPVRCRYDGTGFAEHVIGYLNGEGHGVSGIEKAFDDVLSDGGKVTVSYQVDALGHTLSAGKTEIADTTQKSSSGVALTLDRSIQRLAERAAAKYLQKGAVVVLEVPTGKILAMASLPTFPQDDVSSVLDAEDSPLLNRAVSAYSVGSVFKLAAAAAALESGVSPEETYTCTGSISVDGQSFHCFDSEVHGEEDMKSAVANSCNTYFVHLMQQVPPEKFLAMAKSLGFGSSCTLAPGMESATGSLPSLSDLFVPRTLANFSFGQGVLTATPLQIAAMVNAIASGGVYTQPTLTAGTVNEDKSFAERFSVPAGQRVMSAQTASLLRDFMKASVDYGTSERGKPNYGTAGAKTATAQTGVFEDGEELVESWYTGFYPYEDPKFVITVFAEGGDGGGRTCGPVFCEIADGLYGYVS